MVVFILNLAKRLSEKEKKIIISSFKDGETIDHLSKKFNCTNSTIIRNLKRDLGEATYKELAKKIKNSIQKDKIYESGNIETSVTELSLDTSRNNFEEETSQNVIDTESIPPSISEFIEIAPLDYEIEIISRKELSSIPIGEIEFPKVVYMVVSKNIELEIKLLRDYPEWEFLPNDDLKRKTIEIYFDIKIAKRVCSKEQKVIKVPNTDVFRIASPILISRGISRIVSSEKLIAL